MTDRLVELMSSEQCRPLLARLRKKLERGESLTGRCRFSKLTRSQANAITKLTGVTAREAGITVDLDLLTQVVVNTGRFASLESLLRQSSDEPIENLRAARDKQSARWQQVWQHAQELIESLVADNATSSRYANHSDAFTIESVSEAVEAMTKSGWLRRVTSREPARATKLLNDSFSLLKLLPTSPTPLPVFAAKHCGNAHALDDHSNLGRVMLKLLTKRSILVASPKKALTRRRIWESVGIVTDELSSTVLSLNLPSRGTMLTDRLLQDHRSNAMPTRLTFRHLRLHPPTFSVPASGQSSIIFVCENPSILAEAANRLGVSCPPLICVEGHPSLACWVLLDQLSGAGYHLAYHGDFDWGGIRIANKIYAAFGFEPWQFTSSHHRIRSQHHRRLRPPQSEALWDQSLATTIRQSGVSIEEESMIDELLDDLAIASR